MKRAVFAWELGANYGHLARGLPFAECLRKQGFDVSFALRDVRTAEEFLTPAGFPFVACPFLPRPLQLPRPPINYSQILAEHGYVDRSTLSALVRAWVNLLRALAAQVVIIDHAPTALLAARILSIPSVLLGAPFSIPPLVSPLPPLRPWLPASTAELLQADERVLATINDVLVAFNRRPLDRIADLFSGLPTHLTTLAELDCYRPRPEVSYLGPITGEESHPQVRWEAHSDRKRVFAYLRSSVAGVEPLLSALRQAPVQLICVMPDASESMIERLRREHINVRRTPVDLNAVLPEADVVVNYGSAGIIGQVLFKETPLLLVPHALEQHLNAICVADLGAGIVVDSHRTPERFSLALSQLLSEPSYGISARAFADKYSTFDPRKAMEQAVFKMVNSGFRS